MPRFLVRRCMLAAALSLAALAPAAQAVEPGINVLGTETSSANENVLIPDLMGNWAPDTKWVRVTVSWAQMEPTTKGTYQAGASSIEELRSRLARLKASNLKVLAVLNQAPDWSHPHTPGGDVPPDNPADYGDFAGHIAKELEGNVDAWELWNEPDGDEDPDHWRGAPDPAKYSAMVVDASRKIRAAAEPDPAIVTAGLTGNNYDFLDKLYDNPAFKDSIDAVGVHTDTACLVRAPDFYYRDPNGKIGRYSFSAYREVHAVMADHGDGHKKVWMTELGWATNHQDKCNMGAGAREGRAAGVTEAEQAQFLRDAYSCLATDPFVGPSLWFSLQDAGTEIRYDHHMGLVRRDGSRKPSYDAFKTTWSGAGPAAKFCGAKVDRDPPSVSIDVPSRYISRFDVKGAATDPTTKVNKIELWVDGQRIEGMNVDTGSYAKEWFGSTKLSYKKHTVELRAYDEANNIGKATATVERLDPKNAPRIVKPRLKFTAKKKGGKIRVRGRVLRALDGEFTETPRGRLRIFFARKVGKKFKRYSRYTKGISRWAVINYVPRRKGKWRVVAKTQLDAPYKNVKSKSFTFRVR